MPWSPPLGRSELRPHPHVCRRQADARAPGGGALCGYVGVPASHPLHGLEYNQAHESVRAFWDNAKEGDIGKRGAIPLLCLGMKGDNELPGLDVIFDVHCSLTFSGPCHESDDPARGICHVDPSGDTVHWFGFDCSHAGDLSPAHAAYCAEIGIAGANAIYRDLHYVEVEVASLARQLKQIEQPL